MATAEKVKVKVTTNELRWTDADGVLQHASRDDVVEIPKSEFDRLQFGEVEKAGKSAKVSTSSEELGDSAPNAEAIQENAEEAAAAIHADQAEPVEVSKRK